MTTPASPQELGYEPIGTAAGAFDAPPPPDTDEDLNLTGIRYDDALLKADALPPADHSVIDTGGEIVVPELIAEHASAPGEHKPAHLVAVHTPEDGDPKDEQLYKRFRRALEGGEPDVPAASDKESGSILFSRERILALAAAGVLAVGAAAVITDGFGTYGPTKQNVEQVKERSQEFLDKLKNKSGTKTTTQP